MMRHLLRTVVLGAFVLSCGLGCNTEPANSKIEFPAGTVIPKEAPAGKAGAGGAVQSQGDPSQYSRENK